MKVSQIAILNEILKKIDLNNQTVSTCGQLEPIFSLKYADISCVIALYFLSFFYEHPVFTMLFKESKVIQTCILV